MPTTITELNTNPYNIFKDNWFACRRCDCRLSSRGLFSEAAEWSSDLVDDNDELREMGGDEVRDEVE